MRPREALQQEAQAVDRLERVELVWEPLEQLGVVGLALEGDRLQDEVGPRRDRQLRVVEDGAGDGCGGPAAEQAAVDLDPVAVGAVALDLGRAAVRALAPGAAVEEVGVPGEALAAKRADAVAAAFTMAWDGVIWLSGRSSHGVADGARLFFFPLMVAEVPAAWVDGGATGLPHRESAATRPGSLADGIAVIIELRGVSGVREKRCCQPCTAREDFIFNRLHGYR